MVKGSSENIASCNFSLKKYLLRMKSETNFGHNTFLCSFAPLTIPRARKSSKENETSSSGLYLSRYGLAIKVSRKAALCAATAPS